MAHLARVYQTQSSQISPTALLDLIYLTKPFTSTSENAHFTNETYCGSSLSVSPPTERSDVSELQANHKIANGNSAHGSAEVGTNISLRGRQKSQEAHVASQITSSHGTHPRRSRFDIGEDDGTPFEEDDDRIEEEQLLPHRTLSLADLKVRFPELAYLTWYLRNQLIATDPVPLEG